MNYYAEFNPRLTKPESFLFQKIISDTLKNKPIFYPLDEMKIPDLKGSQESYLDRFIKKGISYMIDSSRGTIMPFSHFLIDENSVRFYLNPFFLEALMEKNDFKVLDLKNTLMFRESFSKKFYYSFILNTSQDKNILVSLDDLRNLMDLKEYERFYDFERNILKKLKIDINNYSNYILDYKKIKEGGFKNSKVSSIEFFIVNKSSEKRKNITNKFLSQISTKITDYKLAYDLIYDSLSFLSPPELKEIIKTALNDKSDTSFEKLLEELLNQRSKINSYPIITEFEGIYSTPMKLQSELFKKIKFIKGVRFLQTEISSTHFLKKMYFAKEGEHIFFEGDRVLIAIIYSTINATKVKIHAKF